MKQEIDCELTEKKHTFTMLPRDGTITIFPKKKQFCNVFCNDVERVTDLSFTRSLSSYYKLLS